MIKKCQVWGIQPLHINLVGLFTAPPCDIVLKFITKVKSVLFPLTKSLIFADIYNRLSLALDFLLVTVPDLGALDPVLVTLQDLPA